MKNFLYFLLMLLFIGAVVAAFSVMKKRVQEKEDYVSNKYLRIDTIYHLEIKAKLIGQSRHISRGLTLLDFTNETYLGIGIAVKNLEYEEPHLSRFIQRSDSIYKRANSDTLFVYRGEQEYYFILQNAVFR